MIEVGREYYYVYDDEVIIVPVSVDRFVTFKYLSPSIVATDELHQWESDDFEKVHKPVTKLHKLLKGIE